MRVCGPILYLNEWTLDGRMIVKYSGLRIEGVIPILRLANDYQVDRVIGCIYNVEVFRNELWAMGEMYRIPDGWGGASPIYVSAAIAGGETREVDYEGRRIVTEGDWCPVEVLVHGTAPLPSLWFEKQTWLEEE